MTRAGIIYLIKNNISGKCYVGLTTKSLDTRWKQHLKEAKKNNPRPLYSSIRKYGEEAFVIVVLEDVVSLDKLQESERKWIKYFSSDDNDSGYNLTPGGNGFIGSPPEEMRKKISASLLGHTKSVETKEKIAAALRGKSHSQEVKNKIKIALARPACKESKRQKSIGKTHTELSKEKIKSSMRSVWANDTYRKEMCRRRRGENNSRAILNEHDVVRIRSEWKSGGSPTREVDRETCRKYAEQFGCTPAAIFRVLRGHSWKHVQAHDSPNTQSRES